MKEDEWFNARVKAALEKDVSVSPECLAALEARAAEAVAARRSPGWRRLVPAVPWLVAAAVSIPLVFSVMMRAPARVSDEPVTSVIALFLVAEGAEMDEIVSASPAEALMAWQEAPCGEML